MLAGFGRMFRVLELSEPTLWNCRTFFALNTLAPPNTFHLSTPVLKNEYFRIFIIESHAPCAPRGRPTPRGLPPAGQPLGGFPPRGRKPRGLPPEGAELFPNYFELLFLFQNANFGFLFFSLRILISRCSNLDNFQTTFGWLFGQFSDNCWFIFGQLFGQLLGNFWLIFGHFSDHFLDHFWTSSGLLLDHFWTTLLGSNPDNRVWGVPTSSQRGPKSSPKWPNSSPEPRKASFENPFFKVESKIRLPSPFQHSKS